MNHRFLFLVIAITAFFLWTNRSRDAQTPELFATKVLDQYIKFYCPQSGTCTRKDALSRMHREWPHVYQLGFQELEQDD